MIRIYICHPYETYGEPEENMKKEEAFVNFLKSQQESDLEYIRPFKLVRTDISRDEAMAECFRLIDTCDALIAAPNWNHSEGCCAEVEYAWDTGKRLLGVDIKGMEIIDV